MHPEAAEILALNALAFVVSDERTLRTLLTQTGLTAPEMREAAGTRAFQAGVLDFLTRHEDVLIAFCEAENIDPALPVRALRTLTDSHGESNQ